MKLRSGPATKAGCCLIAAFCFSKAIFAQTAASAPPLIVPSLRQWTADFGTFALATNAVIAFDSKYPVQLSDTAQVLGDDLKQFTHGEHRVVAEPKAKPGEIFLTLDNPDPAIGEEGYVMRIGDGVIIQAATDNGVFYGTQTLLQMAKQSLSRGLPRGMARDYPLCHDRDEMIDVGRRYYQVSYLEEQIRDLAWKKMNTLHLHFSDWNGFRLMSDTYPGLATPPAYSKADIRHLQDVAKRYHVIIVPEIDMPAHAKAMTDYDPKLRFECSSMDSGHWPGAKEGGWMLDITRPEVRAWIKALLDEFIPLFDGPYFHIGCDEWEYEPGQMACPELMAYMKAKGYKYPTDVFVEWINEVDSQVKAHGKTMQIWNWWDFRQHSSIQPNKDIVINSWTASPNWFLKNGWKTICTPEEELYVAPGVGGTMPGQYGYFDSKKIYEDWVMPSDPNLIGFKVCRWSDNDEWRSDAWFDHWAQRPLQVLAERVWGGPRSATVDEFFQRADAIGAPPQVPHLIAK